RKILLKTTDDKKEHYGVELKRLFKLITDAFELQTDICMDLLSWRLYDTCGVHHVSTKTGLDIFMLVEKDYPMARRLPMLMSKVCIAQIIAAVLTDSSASVISTNLVFGIALQNLNQLCHVSYTEEDRTFTSQEWNRLFRIQERVVREYVMEFLSSFTFRDHIIDLDNIDTVVFQLGGVKRSMTMRQFILALGLYTPEEMVNDFVNINNA
ncbi:hypothetical protein Tco_1053248, partial [Tanacetum coccineum]